MATGVKVPTFLIAVHGNLPCYLVPSLWAEFPLVNPVTVLFSGASIIHLQNLPVQGVGVGKGGEGWGRVGKGGGG